MSWKLVESPKALAVLYYPKLWEPQWPMWAPLDMFAIATALLHAGYEVVFLDERIDPEPRRWLEAAVGRALFVGLSGKFGDQCRHMVDAARFVKSVRPEVPVVAGGWMPSLFPQATLECEAIDAIVQGPGDFSVVALADRLLEGKSLAGIPGVWAREDGRIVGEHFGHLPPLSETRKIPWDVVNLGRYVHPHGWINYFSSRGCPGGCTFCAIYCLDPRRWTAFPAERVVDDWEWMVRNIGVRSIRVLDTDFCADQRRVDAICDGVLRRGLELRFEVLGRHWNLRRLTDEQIVRMRRAGCTEIEVGVESGSQRIVDMIDKQLDVTEVVGTFRRFVERGIRIKANVMFGVATETRADLRATMRILRDLKALGDGIRVQLFRYMPLPDAPMNEQVWSLRQRGHDGHTPRTLAELLAVPTNEDAVDMFWLTPEQERAVKRAHFFYAPLAFYSKALEPAASRRVWKHVLQLFRVLARWRARHCWFDFPIEMKLNEWFGTPLRRGDDDGITAWEDVLPAPFMGDSTRHLEPLPIPAVVREEPVLARPDGPTRTFWIQG
jgi:radical SAM superfamily enzyme YgiQ (UPF0313 family)